VANRRFTLIGGFLVFVAINNLAWYRQYTSAMKLQAEVLRSEYMSWVKPPIPKPQHHYRFEMRGASTWRFDEGTGEACMITGSQAEEGLWATMRCPPTDLSNQ
jgi:hypothetical protein